MELNILHLYPDCMSLYGEYANVVILRRLLETLGVTVRVTAVGLDDTPDFTGADFIYMGAGTERTQKAVLAAMAPHAQALKAALEGGAVALFTGNAMELLGACVTDAGGKCHAGLGLADFVTVETPRRDPVDVIAHSTLWDAPAVGFMNKCSVTGGVTAPLFDRLTLGFGNEAEQGAEGYVDGNLFATHLTGPVLVKNPDFASLLLARLYAARHWELPEAWPQLPHQRAAYDVTLRELSARVK